MRGAARGRREMMCGGSGAPHTTRDALLPHPYYVSSSDLNTSERGVAGGVRQRKTGCVGRRGAWMEAERGMYVPLGGACSGDNVHLDRERRSHGTEPRASKGVLSAVSASFDSPRARAPKPLDREN